MSQKDSDGDPSLIWDRGPIDYRVAAVAARDEGPLGSNAAADDGEDQHDGLYGYLIELPSPLLAIEDIRHIITLDNARIYPPIKLNKTASVSHVFDDVVFPVGDINVASTMPIPDHAVRGVVQQWNLGDAQPFYGLRVDCANTATVDKLLANFLSTVRMFTHQWWISSRRDPFLGGVRMAFELESDFAPRAALKSDGMSPWYGYNITRKLVGFEQPLSGPTWMNIAAHLERGLPVDDGLTLFLEAVEHYMGFSDHRCIMTLALLFEICENKARLMDGRSIKSKNKHLLDDPTLARDALGKTFRKIITDRDNIAHGRSPHHQSARPEILTDYLYAGFEFVNLYLDKCKAYGWIESLQLSLS